jgi:hypothetical protein
LLAAFKLVKFNLMERKEKKNEARRIDRSQGSDLTLVVPDNFGHFQF